MIKNLWNWHVEKLDNIWYWLISGITIGSIVAGLILFAISLYLRR